VQFNGHIVLASGECPQAKFYSEPWPCELMKGTFPGMTNADRRAGTK
jgi:hypothetical protein